MNRISRNGSALAALVALGSGCTTTMTSMTDARAYEPGEIQVAVNMQANVHSNVVVGATRGIESASEVFAGDEPIEEEQFRDWLDLVLLGALFRPAPFAPELVLRAGVTDEVLGGLDVGFRTNFSVYEADVKLQLWENAAQNQFASVMVGYGYHASFIEEWVSLLTLTDFSRSDLDAQILWGIEVGDFLKVNLGPHLIASRVSVSQKLPDGVIARLPESVTQYNPNQLFENEWLTYLGGNATVMVGYKYAYLVGDLGVFWLNFRPTVVGEEREYSGAALSIAGGLSVHLVIPELRGR